MNSQEEKDFGLPNQSNFEPIKADNKIAKIAAISALFLTFGFAVYWFYIRKPDVSNLEESLGLERDIQIAEVIDEIIIENFDAPKAGEVINITEASSKYYVVVGSFIDRDLAMDFAKKLSKSDTCVYAIPNKGIYCYVAVEQTENIEDAKEKANSLRSKYKNGTWVLFY